ncbi:tetratricopeptide repeat protein [Streptomyces puniciscabiei]|uniref:tetratricopeptide repeat protein n=1 Tax=Streptomyces puniciscabiei TaxID=164348 RepID=UPI00332C30F5
MSHPPDAHGADPSEVTTPLQLAECLERLRKRRKLTFVAMERRVKDLLRRPDGRQYQHVSKTSFNAYATGKHLPSQESLLTYLAVCEVSPADVPLWLSARRRAQTADLSVPAGAIRVRDASPRRLGVRAAIEVEGASGELPVYVRRDLDGSLRAALASAAENGGFLLLNGQSSVGKTRTLYEAVLAVLPDWWLVHPRSTDAIRDLAAAPTSQTVLWLDELQGHLSTANGLSEGTVQTMLHAGMVLVGTIWTTEYQARVVAPRREWDSRQDEDRRLFKLAKVFDVADAFTAAEYARAKECAQEDRRVRVALDSPDTGFTQVLAAAPDLVRQWELAPDPYAKHVITAAVDARRLGVHSPVSEDFLKAAVRGYLIGHRGVAPRDWFRKSIEYAEAPLRGVAQALIPCADADMEVCTGYIAADYLLQWGRRTRRTVCPEDPVWRALTEHCHEPEDLERLARSAVLRMRYSHAAACYERLAACDDWSATEALAEMLLKQGRIDDAIEVLRPAVRADWHPGRSRITTRWAGLMDEQGRAEEAIGLLPEGGVTEVLTSLLVRVGRSDEAVAVARRWDDGRNGVADAHLADLLAELGDVEALRARAAAGNVNSIGRLAELLARRGRRDEAIRLLMPYINTERGAADRVVELLVEDGRVDEAVAVLRPFVEAGYSRANAMLAEILLAHGRRDEAVDHLRTAAARDWNLGEFWAEHCPVDELAALANTGSWPAVARWTALLAEQGHLDQALAIVKPIADNGSVPAARHLTDLLADNGRLGEALDMLRDAIASGEPSASWWAPEQLARILFSHGLVEELREEVDAGTRGAAELLRQLTNAGTGRTAADRDGSATREREGKGRYLGFILPEHGVC